MSAKVMDNNKKNALALFCLLFVVGFSFVFCDSIQFTKYDYKGQNNGKCIGYHGANIFETEAQDALSCGKMCHLEDGCESFVYDASLQWCIGCRYKYDDTPTADTVTYPISFSKAGIIESDCLHILRSRPNAPSGTYEIRLWKSKKKIEVYCDMWTDCGGWTVFQNRFNGSVDFHRNFSEYENGFGSVDGEFWLGKENTNNFLASAGNDFTTFDIDRNGLYTQKCAEDAGAWWYNNAGGCSSVELNGAYPADQDEYRGFTHFGFVAYSPLKASKMMVRRVAVLWT